MDKALTDAVAQRIGLYDVPGVMVGNPIRDAWNANHLEHWQPNTRVPRPNAMHFVEGRGVGNVSVPSPSTGPWPSNSAGTQSSWMRDYLSMCLYHAVELGVTVAKPLAD